MMSLSRGFANAGEGSQSWLRMRISFGSVNEVLFVRGLPFEERERLDYADGSEVKSPGLRRVT